MRPLINVLLSLNIAAAYRDLWPGVQHWEADPLVLVQVENKKITNKEGFSLHCFSSPGSIGIS